MFKKAIASLAILTTIFLSSCSDNNSKPEVVTVDDFTVVGIAVRTSNDIEFNSGQSKIGKTWDRYIKSDIPSQINNIIDENSDFGVYYWYESDKNGVYSVAVGKKVSEAGELEKGLRAFKIQKGKYLHFKGEGDIPQATIDTWAQIWKFFEETKEFERAYKNDFEVYNKETPNKVDIFIKIKE